MKRQSASDSRPSTRFSTRVRKNTKRCGERSEAAFLNKASQLGFGVAKPWGDSERYDFILDNGHRLLRVQIKATDCLRGGAYETRAMYTDGKGRAVYSLDDIDFLVAHIVPLDVWYVLPVCATMPAPMLRFYPHRKARRPRFEQYREAWALMELESAAGWACPHHAQNTPCPLLAATPKV